MPQPHADAVLHSILAAKAIHKMVVLDAAVATNNNWINQKTGLSPVFFYSISRLKTK
jgi:hypothetical protein